MTRIADVGWGSCWHKAMEGRFDFAHSEFQRVAEAFERGDAFVWVTDLYGDRCLIRLGDVCRVAECTPDGYRRWQEAERERKAEELVEGT